MKLSLLSVLTTAVLTSASAIAVAAEEAELKAPMSGVTLHEGGISMSVYYLGNGDTLEVVLTYNVDAKPYAPERIRLNLDDGESTRLSLPGQPQLVYALSRRGEELRIEATPARQGIALVE